MACNGEAKASPFLFHQLVIESLFCEKAIPRHPLSALYPEAPQ
ncbi:hypothetical protein CU665_21055 [Pseudomonas syringae pv. actinidifoliorum]|nr:hypothetical protein [Pseudomonas syringae pv. actinidifoliorum]NAT39555.1 hypothetical protein [Pseudomonas syringae pv. actinidifoliorum]